ncbi:MAG: ATP-binding protein [Flavobacteriales bacterium]|nr:ATP-binding protein [Flavobacteriales bacterium]
MSTNQIFSNETPIEIRKSEIYYEVRDKSKILESPETFRANHPIEAREAAFNYIKKKMIAYEEINEIVYQSFTNKLTLLNTNFGGEILQKYHSNQENIYQHIQNEINYEVYMIIPNLIKLKKKIMEINDDEYLIYSWNPIKKRRMIWGLLVEFKCYSQLKYGTKNYLEKLNIIVKNRDFNPKDHTIISTPIDWKIGSKPSTQINKIVSDMSFDVQNIQQQKNTCYTTELTEKKWAKQVASFLNSESGLLIYGMDDSEKSFNILQNTTVTDFENGINLLKQKYFSDYLNAIVLYFLSVKGNTIAVFKISRLSDNPVYIAGKFYTRINKTIFKLKRKNAAKFKSSHISTALSQALTVDEILEFL